MSWQKIFENQEDGQGSGSITGLVSAIRDGADVKVAYDLPGSQDVFWSRPLSSVTVTSIGSSGIFSRKSVVVSGIVTDVPDTNVTIGHRPSGPLVFGTRNGTGGRTFAERPFAYEWQIFNSSGQRQVVKFDASTHQVLSNSTSSLRMYWYVNE